ncbi:MAG TPA: HupE/UreJ family protein [Polyangia bacterium]|jgi:hypothetical protein
MRLTVLLAAAICLAPAAAAAHQSSIVYSAIDVRGREVRYAASIKSDDLAEALGRPTGQRVTPAELQAGRAAIGAYVGRRVQVTSAGAACTPALAAFATLSKTDGFFAQVSLTYTCPHRVEALVVEYGLFFDLDPRHQGFARLGQGAGARQHVFRRDARRWALDHPASAWQNAGEYLVLGIEHIFTGYDHIMFLAGLLVVAAIIVRRQRDGAGAPAPTPRGLGAGFAYTFKVITAFTLAHSITLLAAAQGVIQLPARLTESGIALSIAAIGVLNLAVEEREGGSVRWLVAFGFGLVHGFGFASILREVGLPERGLVLSLLAFNVGVEIGQACIVACLFPLLHLVARSTAHGYRAVVVRAGSLVIILFGAFWLVERAFVLKLLGGRLG